MASVPFLFCPTQEHMATDAPAAPTDSAPSPAPQPPSAQPSQETGRRGVGDFFANLFGSGRTEESSPPAAAPASKNDPAPETGERTGDAQAQATPPETAEPADDWAPPTSKEEEQKRIQAEADRRDERRRREEARKQREEEDRQREQAKSIQNARLRQLDEQEEQAINDGDADLARQIRQERKVILAQVKQGEWVSGLMAGFDAHLLVPLLAPLPQAEQERIVEEIQELEVLPGRKVAVEKTLKALESQWRSDEATKTRQKLLTDDAFWREVRAARGFEDDEAEHVQGRAAGAASQDANAALLAVVRGR